MNVLMDFEFDDRVIYIGHVNREFEGEPDEVRDYEIFCDALFKKRLEVAESIVRNDFKKTLKRKPFNTLLHLAVERENINAIEYLLSKKASIKFKNTLGETPLHAAVRGFTTEILDIICSHISCGFQEKTNINPMDNQGLSHMHIACISNNSLNDLHVLHFLDQGVSPNIPVNYNSAQWAGYTPLHFAVDHGNMRVVKLLLQNGADVTLKNFQGSTALHIAFGKGCTAMVDVLLEAHQSLSDGNVSNPSNETGLSHFHIACSQKNASIVEGFIERGADVNVHVNFDARSYCGYTPLHMAVQSRSSDTIALLIKYGANIAAKEARGLSPLHLAFEQGYKNIVDLILNSAAQQNNPENPVDQWNLSHFHIACVHNNLSLMKKFLENGVPVDHAVNYGSQNFPGYTALHIAAEFERVQAAELLLEWNARVDAQSYNGCTPLHVACQQNHSKVSNIIQQNVDVSGRINRYELESKVPELSKWFNNRMDYRNMIELLLRHKSDVNSKDHFDQTPIYHACVISPKILEQFTVKVMASLVNKFESTRFEVVKLLVENGADIFSCNDFGRTVLYHLVELDECLFFIDRSKVKIAELFLKKGVEASVRTKTGMTPLHLAVTKGLPKVVKLLLTNNAEVNTFENISLETPLHKACENLYADIAQMLVDNGADVTAKKKNGRTALHEVVLNSDFDFMDANAKATNDLVIRLLEAGCDVNVQDCEGKTPLHVACSSLNYVGAQVLLQNGADINLEDDSGKAPLSYCLFHCRGNFHRIYYTFYEHITKIKHVGYHVSKKNKTYFSRIGRMHNYFSDESAKYLSSEYVKEFHKMSSKKIGTSSLQDMLQKDSNQLALYAKNKTFRKIVTAKKFSEKFPFFGYLLKLQYKKGCARLKIIKSAKFALEYLIKRELPDECVELIFKDLSNENLKHLVAASDVSVDSARGSQ